MINKVVLAGRITKELELKMTQNNKAYLRFTLAVNRNGKDKGTDFINCVAWDLRADIISKYCNKGDLIIVSGKIQTGSYDGKNGKVYTTDILVDEVQFTKTKEKDTVEEQIENKEKAKDYKVDDSFDNSEIIIDDSNLPFY